MPPPGLVQRIKEDNPHKEQMGEVLGTVPGTLGFRPVKPHRLWSESPGLQIQLALFAAALSWANSLASSRLSFRSMDNPENNPRVR